MSDRSPSDVSGEPSRENAEPSRAICRGAASNWSNRDFRIGGAIVRGLSTRQLMYQNDKGSRNAPETILRSTPEIENNGILGYLVANAIDGKLIELVGDFLVFSARNDGDISVVWLESLFDVDGGDGLRMSYIRL